MKGKMKRGLVWLVVVLACMLCFVACNKNTSTTPPDDGGETGGDQIVVTVPSSEISMTLKEEKVISASVNKPVSGTQYEYTSSAPDVVYVDDAGKMTAKKTGEATITVKYGEATATVRVTVSLGGQTPRLEFAYLDAIEGKYAVNVNYNETTNLTPTVFFNGNNYDDFEATYEVENNAVGAVNKDTGVFTPAGKGSTKVIVKATWCGIESDLLQAEATVTVQSAVSVWLNDHDTSQIYNLYTYPLDQNHPTSMPFAVHAEENGEPMSTGYEIESGEGSVITISDNTLTAVGAGEATVRVFGLQDQSEIQPYKFKVSVKRPVIQTSLTFEFDASVAEIDANTIFTENIGVKELKDAESALESDNLYVQSGKLYGFEIVGKQQRTVVLYNDLIGYEVKITPISKIITQASELSTIMDYAGGGSSYANYGYYVLGNDIIDSSYQLPTVKAGLAAVGALTTAELGFRGVFDGRGYTISGITFNSFGLFGYLGNGGVIQNVAFDKVKVRTGSSANYPSLLACYINGATIENVYINVAENSGDRYTPALAYNIDSTTEMRNVVVMIKNPYTVTGSDYLFGSFVGMDSEKVWNRTARYTNVFVIAQDVLCDYNVSSKTPYTIDAAYVDGVAQSEDLGAAKPKYIMQGVERFSSLAKFTETQKDLDGFENGNWTVNGKVLTWKRAVENFYSVKVDGEDVDSITMEKNGGNKTLTALFGGYALTDGITFETSETAVARVDGSTLIPESIGATTLIVKYNNVEVYRISVEVTGTVLESAETLYLEFENAVISQEKLKELFDTASAVSITAVKTDATGVSLSWSDGAIVGFAEGHVGNVYNVTLVSDGVSVKVNVIPVTKILVTFDDLKRIKIDLALSFANSVFSGNKITGYYVLGQDIDCKNGLLSANATSLNAGGVNASTISSVGFQGVFDGRGFTIKNAQFSSFGLFGILSNGAVVKNVAFTNVTFNTAGNNNVLAAFANNVTVQNVYVQLTQTTDANGEGIFLDMATNVKLKDNLFVVGGNRYSSRTQGSLSAWFTPRTETAKLDWNGNVIISNIKLCEYNGTTFTVDAGTVDGVAQTASGTDYIVSSGIERYTTAEKAGEKSNGAYASATASRYWTVASDGTVTWTAPTVATQNN